MKYKYLAFDVGGTLLYVPNLYETIRMSLKKFSIPVEEDLIKQRHKILSELIISPIKTSKKFYNYFNSELLYSLGIVPNEKIINSIYESCSLLSWAVFDDVRALKNIKLPIGLISNWDNTLENKARRLLPVRVSHIISSSNLNIAKPDKKFFLNALSMIPFDRQNILYVGNSIKLDVDPAISVGLDTVLIDRDNDYPQFIGKRVRSLFELKEILKDSN